MRFTSIEEEFISDIVSPFGITKGWPSRSTRRVKSSPLPQPHTCFILGWMRASAATMERNDIQRHDDAWKVLRLDGDWALEFSKIN